MSAKSVNFVRAELRKQGMNPGTIKPKGKPLFGSSGKTISGAEITFFSRQMATMMASGVPMVQALEILSNGQKNPRFANMIKALRDDVSGGSAFSEALKAFPIQFNDLYRNLVKAGEGAGVLDTVLDTLATYLERIQALKGKIKKALFYPAGVMAVGLIVSLILLIYVIPQFKETFASFGAELPAFTQLYVSASEFTVANWWWMLGASLAAVFGLSLLYKASRDFQRTVDRLALKIPVLGQVLHMSAISRFARTLALTFKAGVPLVEALDTVAGATGSIMYDEAVAKVRDDVAVGYSLNLAMKQIGIFPPMVVQMVGIGEESGALDSMLFKVAEFYEQEVNNAVDAMTSLMEPFIIVVLGTLVGGMVIAMYLPIFKLGMAV
ncbi:type II secretion system F family protein [Silanimonas sp.]|uniref:type II secretion system F family protein n=1 Tax=Silanimonas sp. TaxID=1929290 RepID=UPI0022BF798E|nr:type II secretion system F family protein [Silanimonas sp.]MCZ8062365.1 type II secretion system F family protein [Silanimonas sp.]